MQDLLQNIWLSLEGVNGLGMMADRRIMYFALSIAGRECWTVTSRFVATTNSSLLKKVISSPTKSCSSDDDG